jgi:heme exporter protein A
VTGVAIQLQEAPAVAALSAVKLIDVSKSIDDRGILREINVAVPPRQFLAVLGANGSGKSTLLRIIATLMPPSSGKLKLFGECAGSTSAHLRRRIGLIGDQSMLYRDLSARENLEFFARLYGVTDPAARAQKMIEMIGLTDRAGDPVRKFSRGMTQRVAIARALLHDPELLLADEPFAGLDAPSIDALEQLLGQLHDAGKTIILVNHDIEQSLRLAERAIVLRRGRVVIDQPTQRLHEREVLAEVQA